MQNDKTTLKDLSIFTSDGSSDVFSLIDRTTTQAGTGALRKIIQHPPDSFENLRLLQDTIRFLSTRLDNWPSIISNGTLIMLEKFFESADNVSAPPSGFTLLFNPVFQKIFNRQEYFLTQFSLSHLTDFLNGCRQLVQLADGGDVPGALLQELNSIKKELEHRLTEDIIAITKDTPYKVLSQLNHRARREMKNMVYRLVAAYARLDAWWSMARATAEHKWVFPELLPALPVVFEAKELHHPLLQNPVAYDIALDSAHNFLLLTGANMSGKTTFMRSMGVAALLAHIGMGVPANHFSVSFLQGIITNMQAEDNIILGESYFFAEVQRMKQTAEKLRQPQPNLVLMDELFKGTNVHDAYECSRAVIEGLLNHGNHLMVLSTHLYEVAQQFRDNNKILFSYFVTDMRAGSYHFTYELKEGISDDRIGYLILQNEGVIDLLRKGA